MGRAEADINLLFGLLALQNGLVDQDQLLSAFRTWTRDKGRPIAEQLVARGDIDEPQRALVQALVETHLKQHGGDTEKSLAALGASPADPARLRGLGDSDLNASLGHVGRALTTRAGEDASDRTRTLPAGAAVSAGHRFQILRPHAQGGLGAVFVAVDGELRREVALKQILEQHADDPNSRARFVMEAEITGGLEHPGIVPVYGLGTYADGRPFYAMRFIRGDSLKEAIAAFHADEALKRDAGARSLALRQLLRRFIDVCNAIAFAHDRGVLHRDIKPANIIVGTHGETLVVDWGLAKPVGRTSPGTLADVRPMIVVPASGSTETLPGAAVGTPAFMSPEQAAGELDRLSSASDVYSLGATLYCVLTGKPPFEGNDVGAVLRAVQKGDFPPPSRVVPSLDRSLEAVCLKAMARKPEDRYGSARTLADDVERWAADEPVTARKEPFAEKARRWARRHRTAVTATATAALVALGGWSAVLAVKARDNARLHEAYGRERLTNQALLAANERERARVDLAMEAIRTFHTGVSTDVLLKRKEFADLRAKLLLGAKTFYDKLKVLLQDQKDERSRKALGDAYHDVGELVAAIGSKSDALAAYEQARAIREALSAADPKSAVYRDDLAGTLNNIANLLHATGRPAEALAAYENARAVHESLVKEQPGEPAYRERLARVLNNLGLQYRAAGRVAEAFDALERSRDLREALAKDYPGETSHRSNLAVSLNNLALLYRQNGRTAETLATCKEAQTVLETLARETPDDLASRESLVVVLNHIADIDMASGRSAEALAAWGRAREISERLVRERPNATIYQQRLAGCLLNIGVLRLQTGHGDEARAALDRAKDCYEALAAGDPNTVAYRQGSALCWNNLGTYWLSNGRLVESRQAYERAKAIREALAHSDPTSGEYRQDLAITTNSLGNVHRTGGHMAEALAAYTQAREQWKALVKDEPDVPEYRHRLAVALDNMGAVLASTGRATEAIAAETQASDLWQALVGADPSVTAYAQRLESCLEDLSRLLFAAGRLPDALAAQERLRARLESEVAAHADAPDPRMRLASAFQQLGAIRQSAGRVADAAAAFRRAISIRDALRVITPTALVDQARARVRLGALASVSDSGVAETERTAAFDRAVTDLRRAVKAGFRDAEQVRAATDFGPLRARRDFQALLTDMAFPVDPFVGSR
ncbi:MAG: serine/threonine-protein kinase [Isosphaeraceae bacterium]|nr:serine/threonine-protein kinase [Isosphaeraceae bacterium]